MNETLSPLARLYFGRFPIEKGKWPLWMAFKRNIEIPELEFEASIKYGLKMKLHTREKIDQFIYYWGYWEPNETWALQQLLKLGDTFVDVGANVGYFTLLGARLVGDAGHVHSFEPVPPTFEKMKRNVELNDFKNVTVYPFAVSNESGMVTISQVRSDNPGMNSMRLKGEGGTGVSWQVATVSLDEKLAEVGRIKLMKIDVEGAEYMALQGFRRHLESPYGPDVICEITDPYLRALGSNARELIDLVAGFGYRGYLIGNREFLPVDLEKINPAGEDAPNILFSKRNGIV